MKLTDLRIEDKEISFMEAELIKVDNNDWRIDITTTATVLSSIDSDRFLTAEMITYEEEKVGGLVKLIEAEPNNELTLKFTLKGFGLLGDIMYK